MPETLTIITYVIYLFISLAITVWVGRTLHKNGRLFLVENFHGHEELADSVNHLLLVGFYLINIGFVSLTMKLSIRPESVTDSMEFLSTKIGLVIIMLGAMHFLNIFILTKMRNFSLMQPPPKPAAA